MPLTCIIVIWLATWTEFSYFHSDLQATNV